MHVALALLLAESVSGTTCWGKLEALTAAEMTQHRLEELSGTACAHATDGLVVTSRHACYVKALRSSSSAHATEVLLVLSRHACSVKALRSSSKATSALPRIWTAWAAWETWAGAPQPAHTCHWLPQTSMRWCAKLGLHVSVLPQRHPDIADSCHVPSRHFIMPCCKVLSADTFSLCSWHRLQS